MKHLKPFNEEIGNPDHPKPFKRITNEKHQLDPRILAHNIKHNINDFSEEQILDLFIRYAEQQKNR